MGARIRPSGFPASSGYSRENRQLNCRRGAERPCSGGILSSHLLVFSTARTGQERVSWHRAQRERHPGKYEKPGTVVALAENGQLLVVSPIGRKSHSRDSKKLGSF